MKPEKDSVFAAGFYKVGGGDILFAPNKVTAPTYMLDKALRETYTYPVAGWYWFDDETEARVALGVPKAAKE